MASDSFSLTDNEGSLLALVLRQQPVTAYQIARIYADSPVSNFSASPGKIYPLVRRLQDRGLLSARRAAEDSRGTEHLVCTATGRAALRAWLKELRPQHLLPEDMLRTKLQSLALLTRDEQIEWATDAKTALAGKVEELERYRREVDMPFIDLVFGNAMRSLEGRLRWLDEVLAAAAKGKLG